MKAQQHDGFSTSTENGWLLVTGCVFWLTLTIFLALLGLRTSTGWLVFTISTSVFGLTLIIILALLGLRWLKRYFARRAAAAKRQAALLKWQPFLEEKRAKDEAADQSWVRWHARQHQAPHP